MTSDLQISESAGQRQDRSRQGVRAGRYRGSKLKMRSTRRTGSGRFPRFTRRTTNIWVVMELEDQYQKDPTALSLLYVRSSTGTLVPLNAVASLSTSLGPLSVNHLGQLPAVTVSFNLKPGRSDR